MSYSFAILFSCGLVGMVIGFLIGLACNGDVKKLNETINELEDKVRSAEWAARLSNSHAEQLGETISKAMTELSAWKEGNTRFKMLLEDRDLQLREKTAEVNRLSDLVATLQAKVPARNARGKFVAR